MQSAMPSGEINVPGVLKIGSVTGQGMPSSKTTKTITTTTTTTTPE
jgi:hypothetical protein